MSHSTDVFLSHNWGKDELGRNNHDRVSFINDELQKYGYRTWFDEVQLKTKLLSQIAHGIEHTQGVIVFITKRYHDKVIGEDDGDYCKLEFNYAAKKKTSAKMLAVVMESNMRDSIKWNGTVGVIFADNMFIDMSGDLNNQDYLRQNIELLKERLKALGIKPSNTCNRNKGNKLLPTGIFDLAVFWWS